MNDTYVREGNLSKSAQVESLQIPRPTSLNAEKIVKSTLVFDTLALKYVIDEPFATRCLNAGVKAANVTIVGEASWDETLFAIDEILEKIEKSPILKLAKTAADVHSISQSGFLAVVLVTQGAGMIGTQLWRLSLLHKLGVRSVGLSYTAANNYSDGCGETRNAGLTFLGRDFIHAVNELPLILDLSHVGHRSREEATVLARSPACTHANAFSLIPNDRNVKDETAISIVKKGGIVSACALPNTVYGREPTVAHFVDHIDYFRNLLGEQNIGIGFDFSEGLRVDNALPAASVRWRTLRPDIFGSVDDFYNTSFPEGIETIDKLPNVVEHLLGRRWSEASIKGLLGENWFRFMKSAIDERM
ncbi:membrane dipeptidase [Sinorhizobium meliloti]|uniref:membrane dipeptidase n=1 Tax=Rhizobium meliloti TaxID=382 RepID=UPI001297186C|nr:membrane dipeptidase [Sinorhizobium meliloti]MQW44725.1 peptidase M19 [Sinorhizobium meliloti]